ncbi:transcriptional regulator, TetR family [Bryocella elongata]|uniref:Transcriptional regulator, TetR family n=1 Tax=Bryocella elongata TaxID=863522 RepID=A0A1H6A5L2_9BACT|nr:TetR/AcrR family transcriptional regulator [Bryocella elongata]SEG43662.1 transcriptional regulator, TetR family [Bryocella elongata]
MRKGEVTRQHIIEEAAALFNRRGYAGCALREIMEATGLEKGGIYRHFNSKEEIAAEAFDYAWGQAFAVRTRGMDEIDDAVDKLRRHVANFTEKTGFPGGCPVLNTSTDADDGNPVLRERVRGAVKRWRAMIVGIVEQGQAAGSVRETFDPQEVATRIIGALEGAVMLARIERNQAVLHSTHALLDSWLLSEVRASGKVRRG